VRSAARVERAGMLGEIRTATVMFVSITSDFLRMDSVYKRLTTLSEIFDVLQVRRARCSTHSMQAITGPILHCLWLSHTATLPLFT